MAVDTIQDAADLEADLDRALAAREAAPTTVDLVELENLATDRWKTVTYGIDSLDASPDGNSTLIQRWLDATRQILGRTTHGAENDAEYSLFCDAEERLLAALGDEATNLVVAFETIRAKAS